MLPPKEVANNSNFVIVAAENAATIGERVLSSSTCFPFVGLPGSHFHADRHPMIGA